MARFDPRWERDGADVVALWAAVWSALATGGLAAPYVGPRPAIVASFSLAAGLCVLDQGIRRARRRAPNPRRPDEIWRHSSQRPGRTATRTAPLGRGVGILLAAALGFVAAPGIVELTRRLGVAAALDPTPPTLPPTGERLVAVLVLAPYFEEYLYRETLLPWFRRAFADGVSVLASSVLFALPHLEARAITAAFLTGILLGALRVRVGGFEACVAMHFGLNGAGLALSGELPLTMPTVSVGASLLGSALFLAWALGPRKALRPCRSSAAPEALRAHALALCTQRFARQALGAIVLPVQRWSVGTSGRRRPGCPIWKRGRSSTRR